MQGRAGVGLQQVVDVLDAGDVTFLDGADALVHPADGRPERKAGVAHLARWRRACPSFPRSASLSTSSMPMLWSWSRSMRSVLRRRKAFSVAVRQCLGGEVVRDGALAPALVGAVPGHVVADLGGDDDAVASGGEGFGDQFLAQAVAVGVGGVEEGDAEVVRPVHQGDGLALGELAPPAGRDRPESEAHRADGQVRVSIGPELHSPVTLAGGKRGATEGGRMRRRDAKREAGCEEGMTEIGEKGLSGIIAGKLAQMRFLSSRWIRWSR